MISPMAQLLDSNLIFVILAIVFIGMVWILTVLACHKRNQIRPHNITVEVIKMRQDYQDRLNRIKDKI